MKRYYQFLALLLVAGMPSLIGLQSLVSADTEEFPVVTTLPATAVAATSATVRGTIIPGASMGSGWFEYGTTSFLGNATSPIALGAGAQPIEFSHPFTGLQERTTYYYRAVGENRVGRAFGNIMTFTTGTPVPTPTPGVKPTVFTNTPSVIGTSAALRGRANPMGLDTGVWFEYGLTADLGARVGEQTILSSTVEVAFTHNLVQLLPNTEYHYRAVAKNAAGTSMGAIISFRTSTPVPSPSPTVSPTPSPTPTPVRVILPIVVTDPVSAVQPATAMFHGTVNPNGIAANVWFEYGPTPALGSTVGFRSLPASFSTVSFGQTVRGLTPSTTYYYRVAAQNVYGDVRGGIVSFTTTRTAAPIFPPAPPVRIPTIFPAPRPTPPAPAPAVQPAEPISVSPESGTFSPDTRSVTLTWSPVAGDVMYAVRVEDKTDSAARDTRNNCPGNPHYICIDGVRGTSIAVPVTPGHTYAWWVHTIAVKWSKAAGGDFSVIGRSPSPIVIGGSQTPFPLVSETPSPSSDLGTNLVTPVESTNRLRLLGFVAVAALGGFALAWLIFGRDRTKES
jgi:hypothetical protein